MKMKIPDKLPYSALLIIVLRHKSVKRISEDNSINSDENTNNVSLLLPMDH